MTGVTYFDYLGRRCAIGPDLTIDDKLVETLKDTVELLLASPFLMQRAIDEFEAATGVKFQGEE